MRAFTEKTDLLGELSLLLSDDAAKGTLNSVLLLGIFTSEWLDRGDVAGALSAWRQAVPLATELCPAIIRELKSYFGASVVRYCEAKGVTVDEGIFEECRPDP